VSGESGGGEGRQGEAWRHGEGEMEEEMRWDRSKRAPIARGTLHGERARAQKGVSARVR
jgi:hypothetical protein